MTVERRSFEAAVSEIAPAVEWAARRFPPWADASLLRIGLAEAVTNAVVHGALAIPSDARGEAYETFLETVCGSRSSCRVEVTMTTDELGCRIRISWDGSACPPGRRASGSFGREPRTSGYGLEIIGAAFHEVTWAEDGRGMELVRHRHAPVTHAS